MDESLHNFPIGELNISLYYLFLQLKELAQLIIAIAFGYLASSMPVGAQFESS